MDLMAKATGHWGRLLETWAFRERWFESMKWKHSWSWSIQLESIIFADTSCDHHHISNSMGYAPFTNVMTVLHYDVKFTHEWTRSFMSFHVMMPVHMILYQKFVTGRVLTLVQVIFVLTWSIIRKYVPYKFFHNLYTWYVVFINVSR